MGDSDDEYDRKGRDKFRGERGGDRRPAGGERERWPERDRNRSRNDYYRPSRYSPPPMKRMRPDFEERGHAGGRFGMHEGYGMYGGYGNSHDPYGALSPYGGGGPAPGPREHHPPPVSDGMTQPPMLTLKQFLATQDDSISDDVAITKYNEYKLEFKRGQMNEFFVSHKDEEWFKLKYHPEMSIVRKEEQIGYLKKRAEVFGDLLTKGDITSVNADTTNTDQLIRLLDTVVIKLEGGSDDDLKVLDEKPVVVIPPVAKPVEDEKKEVEGEEKSEKPAEDKKESKKRRRTHTDSSSSSSDSDSDGEVDKPKEANGNGDGAAEEEPKIDEPVEAKEEEESGDAEMKEVAEEREEPDIAEKEEEPKIDDVVDLVEEDSTPVKKLEELHKTSSIFVRNLAPTITKAEVEALCKRYDGFLRVAIADPAVERRWFRRGWITFKRDVNIKEICWNLNNIRLRDCELAPIVNRDLSRRVRPVNGITAHKTICKNDIKLCAKIAHSLDEKSGLWKDVVDGDEEKKTFGLQSKNPVLKNITDYLIEEADAEEEELLGLSSENKEEGEGEFLDRDPELVTVLDKIIFYLRVVHSVDFYNHCEYPYEDEMPNRCGIIHARGPQPQNKITANDIQEYIKNFETKMSQFLAGNAEVPEEELKKLGAKDIDAEVEKFISANSQELSKDKWLCPLSGKKFKGPDYIRKHIMSKHAEKVEEVKKEVEYFNNYLKDSKRPQLPEHPGNAKKEGVNNSPMYGRQPHFGGSPMPYQGYYGGGPMMMPRGRGGFSRGGAGGRMEMPHRPLIHYRDLDAPSSSVDDIF